MLFKAIEFAVNAHKNQFRKGTKIPYIVHPLNVMKTILMYSDNQTVAIAGVLHDTLEDTDTTVEDIQKNFGSEVTNLVVKASEKAKIEKNLPKDWKSRKMLTLEELKNETDENFLFLSCADKLDNLNDILTDYSNQGDELWSRFNRGKELQIWYYQSLAEIFSSKKDIVGDNLRKVINLYLNQFEKFLKQTK